jgi:hypothetical protein
VTALALQGTWVELRRVVLEPGRRAPQVPADTALVPLEMRVRGFLAGDARIGETATVVTPAGRRLSGTLAVVNPAYEHRFGSPIPELSRIAGELREILRRGDGRQ